MIPQPTKSVNIHVCLLCPHFKNGTLITESDAQVPSETYHIFFKFHNNEDYINIFLFKESNPGYWELTFDKWNWLI